MFISAILVAFIFMSAWSLMLVPATSTLLVAFSVSLLTITGFGVRTIVVDIRKG